MATSLLILCVATTARAEEGEAVIGYVKTVSGDAWVGPRGGSVRAGVGTPVHRGVTIRTGPGATLGVTLKDNTVMSFGPDSELTVDDYVYAPERGEFAFGASIVRGTLNFVSGLIARMRPEAVSLRTPTGTLGVRGTHFLVKIEDAPR